MEAVENVRQRTEKKQFPINEMSTQIRYGLSKYMLIICARREHYYLQKGSAE